MGLPPIPRMQFALCISRCGCSISHAGLVHPILHLYQPLTLLPCFKLAHHTHLGQPQCPCLCLPSDVISLAATTVKPYEDIAVSFKRDAGATTTHWIAIFSSALPKPTTGPPAGSTLWFYMCQSQSVCASPVYSIVVTFSSATPGGAWPLAVGDYYAWYLDNDLPAPVTTTPASPIAFTVAPGVCSRVSGASQTAPHTAATTEHIAAAVWSSP